LLWQQHRDLAVALRDQGLADFLAARFALRPIELQLFARPITFAHLVVAKSQQAVEKVTKGYLLWHSQSFDPTKGHTPFTHLLEDQPQDQSRALARLSQALNYVNKKIVRQIKWLESLAPRAPDVPEAERGNLQPLNIISESTEYPFWSQGRNRLVSPAEGITLLGHGAPAFKAARTYLVALGQSDPQDYCLPIRGFLNQFSLSTEVTEWPPSTE
jgi:hypothetical protein